MPEDKLERLSSENYERFLFEDGLYKEMLHPSDFEVFKEKYTSDSAKGLFCPFCKKDSIFKLEISSMTRSQIYIASDMLSFLILHFSTLKFVCSYDKCHTIKIYSHITNDKIIKVGQYPSIADIQFPQLNKYEKHLKTYAKEFKRSMGLASHGIGIGSFVYLRRIFEFILEETHNNLKGKPEWDEDEYQALKHLEERIDMCEKYQEVFPDEMKPHKMKIYGVLSKGIHELDEQECLNLFPSLQLIIEHILDERIHQEESKKKLNEALKNLSTQ